jgi:cyclic pyranopterin monophosphate synthase
MSELTHLDESGRARMVDVGGKGDTERVAVARGEIRLGEDTLALVREGKTSKGDVLAVARVAGIMAAKKTSELIPLCHPIMLTSVEVDFSLETWGIQVEARARTTGPTGVEMEALTAVSVAALTLYDMLKSVERGARITNVRLVRKEGGKSGVWERDEATHAS